MHLNPNRFHSPRRLPERRPVSRRLVKVGDLCAILNITDRTLLRWLNDPTVDFPQPRMIRKTRYWSLSQIERFIEQHFDEPSA